MRSLLEVCQRRTNCHNIGHAFGGSQQIEANESGVCEREEEADDTAGFVTNTSRDHCVYTAATDIAISAQRYHRQSGH